VVEVPVIAGAGFAAISGAIIGSFGATAALRMEVGVSPWSGRSKCDGCARVLSWAETVPFAGYIASRGRCGACGQNIHGFHIVGEGLGACVAVCAVVLAPFPVSIVLALLGMTLLIQSLIDVRTFRLPDGGNLIVAALAAALAVLRGTWIEGVIAAVASVAVLLVLKAWLERREGTPMLGLGDVKLITALALGLGQWTAAALATASILTLAFVLVFRKRRTARVAFGPAIACAGFSGLLILSAGGLT
jgi:leader peptidase (prepilin peptidase) / N-methyltransferase